MRDFSLIFRKFELFELGGNSAKLSNFLHMASNKIEIYQSTEGDVQLDVRIDSETVWLNQEQLSQLFGRDRTVIGRHIRNVFKEEELDEEVVCAKFAHTTQHGAMADKMQETTTKFYNLDVIISVGYRVKSLQGTQFRQWATQRLKDYLVKGYAINEQRLEQTQQEVRFLKSGIQILSRAIEEKATEEGLEWLNQYAKGLTLLDDYDHEQLDTKGVSKQQAEYPTQEEYQQVIEAMKAKFDSAVFGLEKDKGFESAVSQIAKGFGDEDFYPTLEEKAAMLLYLVIKNHAFADGNKRIAAACFLLFLKQNAMLINSEGEMIISNEALASLTLFIASSKPEEMQTVKNLTVSMLNRNKKE
ncbi:RhuM family protein [Roseivirga sp. BDSF3-8]|uniref:RhuM family protein n=1 Tax=Roseivirga sp. BDSF3-8 TaxID=3241598 RepID=UPI0035323D87